MKISHILKSNLIKLTIYLAVMGFTGIFLSVLGVNIAGILFLEFLYGIAILISLCIEYFPKKVFYDDLLNNLEQIDKKYLLAEIIEEPDSMEGKILCDCLKIMNKSMNDEIAKYRTNSKDYREYIELWIHEVKTPIASSRLIIENHPDEITKSIAEELDILDYYLEQVLFYSRSNTVEKDYIIKGLLLKEVVQSVVRKNSKAFIRDKIQLTMENLDVTVYSDEKWLEYILGQIVINAIKYKKDNPKITIYAKDLENAVCLYVKDNGIGISEKDLPKVFEKGYTGNIGRKYRKATGIGLYLAKKLCNKLGLSIAIRSEESVGTEVEILFPKANLANVLGRH